MFRDEFKRHFGGFRKAFYGKEPFLNVLVFGFEPARLRLTHDGRHAEHRQPQRLGDFYRRFDSLVRQVTAVRADLNNILQHSSLSPFKSQISSERSEYPTKKKTSGNYSGRPFSLCTSRGNLGFS